MTKTMNKKVSKWKIMPKMALTGVIKNGAVYYPYIGAGIFSVFTFFVFSSILHNDLIKTLPNSSYAWMLLQIGKVLLGIILLPFLFYTNSFLIKRRKKEIGLYSILGMEKKHIGSMLFLETAFIYVVILAGGIISGTVLSKLLFLLLLKMTGLPMNVEFVFYPAAFKETIVFFFWVYAVNFISNMIQVGRSRPVELMSGSRRGEKEPKLLWLYALAGFLALGAGYVIAVRSKVDGMIFTNFFLAVFLVIVGTWFLFTSGSVAFLKLLKKKKGVYYKPQNFITISGMLYRMKKNAASLVNICIFSTMIMITLACTASLYLGLDDISDFDYPYDANIHFQGEKPGPELFDTKLGELEQKYSVTVDKMDYYDMEKLSCLVKDDSFQAKSKTNSWEDDSVYLLTLEDYNRLEKQNKVLEDDEILLLDTGSDYGYPTVTFFNKKLKVKEELQSMFAFPKADNNQFGIDYYMIVKDRAARDAYASLWAEKNGVEDISGFLAGDSRVFNLSISGEKEDRNAFVKEFQTYCEGQTGFSAFHDNLEGRARNEAMNGGLLFIGILFSLIFLMCLILIMYYKQISEGYEDKAAFSIMQKVGMSDREIKGTIRRQILLVFFLPLVGAVLHTLAGMFMVNQLMATLRLYNTALIAACAVGVAALFVVFYGVSYFMTAKTYYRIVRQGER